MQSVKIQVKGRVNKGWSERLGGLCICNTLNGNTVLSGCVRDQSALLSVLNKLPDLGLQLLSVTTDETKIHET
jgi:hypothetical protein